MTAWTTDGGIVHQHLSLSQLGLLLPQYYGNMARGYVLRVHVRQTIELGILTRMRSKVAHGEPGKGPGGGVHSSTSRVIE